MRQRQYLSATAICCAALFVASCDTEMVSTSNLYSNYTTGSSQTAASNGQSVAQDGRVVPVSGIPYFMPLTVAHLTITGSYEKAASTNGDNGGKDATGKGNTHSSDNTGGKVENGAAGTHSPGDGDITSHNANSGNGKGAEAAGGTEEKKYTITAKLAVEQQPDPSQEYLLQINQEAGTDDDIGIGVNSKGLLQTTNAESTDESAAIIKKVAETAAKVAEAAASIQQKNTGGAIPAPQFQKAACAPNEFTADAWIPIDAVALGNGTTIGNVTHYSIDTQDLEKQIYTEMSATLNDNAPITNHVTIGLKMDTYSGNPDGFKKPFDATPHASNPGDTAPGIRFRLPMVADFTFNIEPWHYGDGCELKVPSTTLAKQRFIIMNPEKDYVFDMRRSPLVKKSIKLTVADGVLTSAEVNKPSTALAIASLPLDLINLLLSPITTLIHGPDTTLAKAPTAKAGN